MKLLSYPLTVLFYLVFGLFLLLFDPIQRICLNLFGYSAHKKSVDYFNLFVVRSLHLLGTTYSIKIPDYLPDKAPVIIASNHQSMWDIPPLIWFLRKLHVKFISKKELGKNIPRISYNLKYGGSVLIDRKNPNQATSEIVKMGRYIQQYNRAVVIFPEGTRSRTGMPKPFKRKGLMTLFENAPDAWILPVSISNSWKLQRFGMFPIPIGTHFILKAHPAIKIAGQDTNELIDKVEHLVISEIETTGEIKSH
ncbi:1-acyl-sn-glycerol-3-phosphate acyltransferase [Aureitalea sp. L0-47]|uniref:lysophospholipid acyltransferase family protein n=1 Tax=Aureitalea sp. L0-47 TaxID=2816962 RepID=UPI0022387639|nr:lysophospholipid acyltransferase family protein [Aureitalea sp. L0-47]MCW5518229.1 1-acyl-sn-glycerol-3-phosphate acyltransferase [Aureitalea sp. L0-47]